MAGDALDISVKAFYKSTDPVPAGGTVVNDMVQSLLGALLGSQTSVVPNGKGNLVSGNSAIVNQSDIGNFINGTQNDPNNQYNNTPKAYLNYVLFDENFAAVGNGYKRVNTADVQTVYSFPGVSVPVNGYVYVWISNESGMNVYYDDLSVQHTTGPIVQENTFYPYGLPIEPLSSYSAIKTANKELYQSKLLDDEMGLNLYYFDARYFDPQTGRFLGMDPKMQLASGYQGMGGNPAMYVDPDGQLFGIDDVLLGMAIGGIIKGIQSKKHGGSFFEGFIKGAIVGAFGGALSGIGGGSFIGNVLWGAGEGVATNGLSNILDGNAFFAGAGNAALMGGAFAAISSDNTRNLFKGQGFRSNNEVLKKFITSENYTGALKYFKMDADFVSDLTGYGDNFEGAFDFATKRVQVTKSAFTMDGRASFDKLNYIYQKEFWHQARSLGLNDFYDIGDNINVRYQYPHAAEDALGHAFIQKNAGAFPSVFKYAPQAAEIGWRRFMSMGSNYARQHFTSWENQGVRSFIYKIPRRFRNIIPYAPRLN